MRVRHTARKSNRDCKATIVRMRLCARHKVSFSHSGRIVLWLHFQIRDFILLPTSVPSMQICVLTNDCSHQTIHVATPSKVIARQRFCVTTIICGPSVRRRSVDQTVEKQFGNMQP